MLRTGDGGVTWQKCNIPPGFFGSINDIFMVSRFLGWAVIEDNDLFAKGLWKTIDGGANWFEVPTGIGPYTSVYQTPAALLYSSRYAITHLGYSLDNGQYFYPVGTDRFNGINFVDDLHGVASVFASSGAGTAPGNAMWTNDGGLHWFTSNQTTEAWGVYAKKGTSTFVIVGEKVSTDPVPTQAIEVSNDYGRTWTTTGIIQGRTTGHIAGVGNVIYVQALTNRATRNRFQGFLRSTDGGTTWKEVGGPSNVRDTRFFVTGCLGNVVYAFDELGGVWMTDDGGDGEMIEAPHSPSIAPNQLLLSTDVCSISKGQSILYNLSCHSLIIDSLGFVDSTDEAISKGALTITKMPMIPFTIDPTKSDTINFLWNPGLLSSAKSQTRFLLYVHSLLPDSSEYFDTTIIVDIKSLANEPVFALSDTEVKFDSLNLCKGVIDTIFTIRNFGCDTLRLDSADIVGSTDVNISDLNGTALSFPLHIPQDSAIIIRVRFKPTTVGIYNGKLNLNFSQKGIQKDTSINFSGSAFRTVSVYSDQSLICPPTSVCSFFDSVLTFRNNSCDTLIIDQLLNSNNQAFELLSVLTLPIYVAPDSELRISVRFHPQKNATQVGVLEYSYHIQNDSGKSFTQIRGAGIPGDAVFLTDLPQPTIKFPDRLSCSPLDSMSFYMFNPGCDSIIITKVVFGGSSAPSLSYKVESQLPKILVASNDSLGVLLILDGFVPASNNGVITIEYMLPDSTILDTTFSVEALIKPAPRLASLQHSILDFGSVPLCTTTFDTILIHNDNCPDLTISDISFAGPDYVIISKPRIPSTLFEGKQDTVIIQFIPTSSGAKNGILTILTDADILPIKTVNYRANVRPIDELNLRIEQVNKNIITADSAMIDVIPDIDWKGKSLKSVSFSLTYNSNLLSYGRTFSFQPSLSSFTSTAILPNGDEQLNVRLTSPSEILLQKNFPLIRFYFTTTLTDTISTPVKISLLEINDDNSYYKSCVLSATPIDGEFIIHLVCGDRTIQDYLKKKNILLVFAPRPDPVNANDNKEIFFPYSVAESGKVEFNIFDALGRQIYKEIQSNETPGDFNFKVLSKQLTGGAFQFRITHYGKSKTEAVGRFVVLK